MYLVGYRTMMAAKTLMMQRVVHVRWFSHLTVQVPSDLTSRAGAGHANAIRTPLVHCTITVYL